MSNSFTYVLTVIFIVASFHPDIGPLRDLLKVFRFIVVIQILSDCVSNVHVTHAH